MQTAKPALVSIVYRSEAAADLGAEGLGALLTASRQHNRAGAITGMLLTEHGRFLQAIEGPEDQVRRLFAVISADPRHTDVEVLADEVIEQRRFPDWAMANGHPGDAAARPLERHFEALLAARQTLPKPAEPRRGLLDRLRGR